MALRNAMAMSGTIVTDYLKALVNSGLYGATVGEVKDRLVCEGIERALRRGVIPRRFVYIGYERQHEPKGRE
jgi:hypothetical protein